MKQLVGLILFLCLLGTFSQSTLGNNAGYGARAVAMGGAYTAIADDTSAPYWNPAGITEIRFIFAPTLGYNGTDWKEARDLLDIETYPPKLPEFELSSQGMLGLTAKHFALNVLADLNADSKVIADGISSNGQARLDLYGVLTAAWKVGEKWSVGVNLKTVRSELSEYRLELNLPYNPDHNYLADASAKGSAFDIGLQYRLNDRIKFGFIARNCYSNLEWEGEKQLYNFDGTKLGPKEPFEVDKKLPQNYVLGVVYQPFESTLLALDIDQIETDYKDFVRIHFGLEQSLLSKTVAIRLGAYTNEDDSPTLTGGLGFKLGPVIIDAAVVLEEDNEGYYLTTGFSF